MKPVDVKTNTCIDASQEINDKDPKLKLVVLLKYQNIEVFLQNFTFQSCLKKFL